MNRSTLLATLMITFLMMQGGCSRTKKGDATGTAADPTAAVEPAPLPQEDAEVWVIPEPDGGLAEPVAAAESTAAADAILEQMKADEKLEVTDEFKKVGKKYGATACLEGAILKIPVLLCEYPDGDAAKANKAKAEKFAKGSATGVVDRNGRTLLAARSSKDLDQSNRNVNRIITAFNKAK